MTFMRHSVNANGKNKPTKKITEAFLLMQPFSRNFDGLEGICEEEAVISSWQSLRSIFNGGQSLGCQSNKSSMQTFISSQIR